MILCMAKDYLSLSIHRFFFLCNQSLMTAM